MWAYHTTGPPNLKSVGGVLRTWCWHWMSCAVNVKNVPFPQDRGDNGQKQLSTPMDNVQPKGMHDRTLRAGGWAVNGVLHRFTWRRRWEFCGVVVDGFCVIWGALLKIYLFAPHEI